MDAAARARTVCGLATALLLLGLPVLPRAEAASESPDRAGGRCTIVGTNGPDRLVGTGHADVICGRGGNDRIKGRGGNDRIIGGGGNDVLIGGAGNDRLVGGGGKDRLTGGGGSDLLTGGPKPDKLSGGAGDDVLQSADRSRDLVRCGAGTDRTVADARDVLAADCEKAPPPPPPPADDAPVAVDDTLTVVEDAGATPVDVLANDTDPDGGLKEVASAGDPGHGTAAVTGSGSGLTYQPDADFCGADAFTYTLNGGSVGHVAVTVSCVDDPPVAVDDDATVDEDSSATAVAVLANDTDAEGDPVSLDTVTTPPAHGTAVVAADKIEYTPAADYCGADSFGYDVAPGGSTATVSVTVSCVDDAPAAVDDAVTVDEAALATAIDVLANDTDIDGGPKTVVSAGDPAHGTVVVPGDGAGLTYEPDASYCGPDSFDYTLNGGASATVTVTVTCIDQPPVAVDDTATVAEDSGATTLDVLANDTDADGGAKQVVSAGDPDHGTATVAVDGGSVSYQPDPNFCGADSFGYALNGGDHGAVDVTVTCVDDPPVAVDDAFTVLEDSGTTALGVLDNDTDVDGDPIAVAGITTAPGHGLAALNGGKVEYTPDLDYCGTDSFGYEVTPGGSTATVTVTVTCVDEAPVAVDDSTTVGEDAPATPVDVLANDTDTDGGPKQVESVDDPAHGTAVVQSGGTGVDYQPDPDFCGADSFTYTLNLGSSAAVAVTVTCVDDPPVAVDDAFTVDEDSGMTPLGVLVNDTDPDGDPVVLGSVTSPPAHGTVATGADVVEYTPDADFCGVDTLAYDLDPVSAPATVTVTVTCVDDAPTAVADSATVDEDATATGIDVLANDTDIDGGPRTVDTVGTPAHGTTTVEPGGSGVTYQPDAGYCGADSFGYTLAGGSGASVSVTVTCLDDPPVAVDDAAAVDEDSGASAIDVLANDTDGDGGPKQVTGVDDPAHGTAGTDGGGTGVTYQPDPNFCGADTFGYTLNGGSTGSVAVTVACLDDPPVAVDDQVTVDEDSATTVVAVLANDTDVDGGPVALNAVTTPAGHGSAVLGPDLEYTPDADYCGTDSFAYDLAPGGSTATVMVTVTCVDDPPTAADDSATVDEDASASTIDVLANDTDADGGPLEVQSATDPAHGSTAVQPGGTAVDYQPAPDFCGADSFGYTLNGGSSATVAVTVTCVDDPPLAVDDDFTLDEDTAPLLDVLANDTDIDGGPIAPTVTTSPAHGTATPSGNLVEYAPDPDYCGADSFVYDLAPGGSSATVTLTVTCVNDAPVADDETFAGSDRAIGNTTLVVDDPTDGAPSPSELHRTVTGDVLDGDTDIDSASSQLAIVAGTLPTDAGGSVAIEADGDFVYSPPASCSITSDYFDYTVTDQDPVAPATDVGRVTLQISDDCVWYVANDGPGNAGTSAAPFDTIAQADAASGANDIVYVFRGSGAGYDGGISLAAGQQLLGEAAPLVADGVTLAAATPANRPLLTRTNGDVVTLGSGNLVRGLTLDPAGTGGGVSGSAPAVGGQIVDVRVVDTGTAGLEPAIELVGTSGLFHVSDVLVDTTAATGQGSGSAGIRLNANLGSVVFEPASSLTVATKGAKALDWAGTNVGTSGIDTVTETGSSTGGVSLSSVTGAVTFGTVTLTTTGPTTAFRAATGATIEVTDPASTIDATGGAGLEVIGSTIGGSGLTFAHLSASGGANGIVLDGTGANGGLTVTGTGGTCTAANTSGCTGGTISGTTGADDSSGRPVGTGIVLRDTRAPSFTRMWLHDQSNYGIRGTGVAGLTLANSVINGSNGTNAVTPYSEASVRLLEVSGTATVSDTYVSGGINDNVDVVNSIASLDRVTFSGVTFGTDGSRPANDALQLESSGTVPFKATVTGSTFTSAAGDLLQFNHSSTGAGDLQVLDSTFKNAHPTIATGGGGVSIFQSGASATTMKLTGNSFRDSVGTAVLIAKGVGGGSENGVFKNNTIGVAGVANSGSAEGSALKLQQLGQGSSRWLVEGNNVRGYNNFGVEVLAGGSGASQSGGIDVTVKTNTIAEPGTSVSTATIPKNGVHFNVGTTSGDTFVACADVVGNTLDASGADGSPPTGVNADVRLRQRQATTIRLPGYAGATNDNTAVQTFVAGQNSAGTAVLTSNTVAGGGGGFVNAACATPVVP